MRKEGADENKGRDGYPVKEDILLKPTVMRDDTTPSRGITENIPPEACMDQPKAVDR